MKMKTYKGSCHCGAVRFEAESNLEKIYCCNCSLCSKAGFLLAFLPADKFTLISGEEKMKDYRFNKKVIGHGFCTICGIHPFSNGKDKEGKPTYAVNVRCLEEIEMEKLTTIPIDGKSF